MIKIDTLTKTQIEKTLKDFERKFANQINRRINLKFNECKKEESILEKNRIDKQAKKDKKEWSQVKNPEERLLGLEQKLSSLNEYLKAFTGKFNEVTEAFNKHVEKNNDDFETMSNALKGKYPQND